VPLALERVIMRAIEKLPADRFQSAEALAESLEELAASRWILRADRLVIRALEHAGLATASEAKNAAGPKAEPPPSVRTAVAGLAVLGAVAVGGGAVLQATAHRAGRAAGSAPLELAPASPGYLRVLATPWAEVWVDGQRLEVTPFARAIPLPPGTHYVTLVHPSAPSEKRSVAIVPGETRTLDVVMAVPELSPNVEARPSAEQSAEREK
jgi:serine/threonine-protein kinase